MAGNLYFGNQQTRREQFDQRSRQHASVLRSYGVEADDVVAILMRNDIVYLELIEACRYLGASYATVNWHATPDEVQHIVEDSGAKALIAHHDLTTNFNSEILSNTKILTLPTPAKILKAYPASRQPGNPHIDFAQLSAKTLPINSQAKRMRGLFAYTSGSTGRPKGIRRKLDVNGQDRYQVYARLAKDMMLASPGDRLYISAPLYHSAPNALALFALAAGQIDVIIEPKFDPERFLADVERLNITHAYIVPTMMVRLLKLPQEIRSKYKVSSLQYALSTGSPFPTNIKAAMIEWFGPIFYESYGASELGFMTLISSQEATQKPGSVGRVLPGGSIRILDENLQQRPAGETGLIYINLPMFGEFTYTNAEGDIADQRHEGHATVGDMGYLDRDGYLYISDRKKDMVISGGVNIFPAEIEAVLIEMPQIIDCAIFGAPDPEFGEKIVAAVQCHSGQIITLDDVLDFLNGKLAGFKIPKILDIHNQLPREDSGKIFKKRLRAPYWADQDRSI